MGLLNRYILRQIWWPMLLASIVISFLTIAGAIQQEIKNLVKAVPIAQFTVWDISKVSFFILPTMVSLIFPITFLFGILLTFSRMAQGSELIALKAAGIPLRRVVLPILVAGAALSALCFWVQDVGQPWAYQRLARMMNSDLPLRVTLDMLPAGTMHEYGDWRVYIGSKDPDGTLRDIVVLKEDPEGVTMTRAETARLLREKGQSILEMSNVYSIPPGLRQTQRFNPLRLAVPQLEPRPPDGNQKKGLNLRELLGLEDNLETAHAVAANDANAAALYNIRWEITERVSFPLMCLAVSFVAAPLGARSRRAGRSFTFASGFAIVVAYFVLRTAMQPHGLVSLGETVFRGEMPNLVLCALGAMLVWRVDRV